MKTATENLVNDHIYIITLTQVMQIMSENKTGELSEFKEIVALVKNFADGLHHAKEENLLFPKMYEKGFSPENGPVAVMLNEHVQGRTYIQKVNEGIDLVENGHQHGFAMIYENMHGYAMLLQNHILKENNILFKMADQAFSEDEQTHLLAEFKTVEDNYDSAYNTVNAIEKIAALASRYL